MNNKTIDLFAELSPMQKKWGKLKGVTQAKISNISYRVKRKRERNRRVNNG